MNAELWLRQRENISRNLLAVIYERVKKEYIRETEDDPPKTEDRNNR